MEAELGRLAGEEDGLSVAEKEAKMTDPAQARLYIYMLYICVCML